LGGYTLLDKDDVSVFADLSYNLGIGIFDNDYQYTTDLTTYKTINIKGFGLDEVSAASHEITPSIGAFIDFGTVAFSAYLDLPITITSLGVTTNELDIDRLAKNRVISETSVSFDPVIGLGVQFPIRDGKITLNAGGEIELSGIAQTTTNSETFDVATGASTNASVTVANSFGTASTSISIGATFHFGDNVWLEATAVTGGNGFNIFGTGGASISAFSGSILFGLRF
jgi:hypothetical protein